MGDWNASFWKNEGPFMAACFLPCIVLGRTRSRLDNPKDPDPSSCNGTCITSGILNAAGLGFVAEIRERYGIAGNSWADLCETACCPCNAAMQQYNEVEMRETLVDQEGYQPQEAMHT